MATYTEQQLFGTDLQLINRDLDVSSSGAFKTATASFNLADAITHRLSTEKGSLIYDQDYGLDTPLIIGEKNIFTKRQVLKLEIIEELSKEPRIQTINSVTITQDENRADVLYVAIFVTPIDSESRIELNLIFPFYLNETVARINNEEQTSTTKAIINTTYNIYAVHGVYLSTDVNRTGKNYYLDKGYIGSFKDNVITLINELSDTGTEVLIDYNKAI